VELGLELLAGLLGLLDGQIRRRRRALLNRRIAISAARMASRNRNAVTIAKPTQTLSSWLSRSSRNHARPWKNVVIPKTRNTPAAAPIPAPRASFEALAVISALASSIS
jgi:hypothetical protein